MNDTDNLFFVRVSYSTIEIRIVLVLLVFIIEFFSA